MQLSGILKFTLVGLCLMSGAQGEQWDTLFQDLISSDPSVSEAARTRTFKTVIPQLLAEDAAALSNDISGIIGQYKGSADDRVRLQASGLLATVAALRADGSSVMRSAIPALLNQMHDSNERIRYNVVYALSNLKPTIPKDVESSLIEVLSEPDKKVVRGAIYGVSRLAVSSPEAVNALDTLLSSTQDAEIKQAVVHSVAELRLRDPQIIERLGELLQDQNRDVVKQSLIAIGRLGPEVVRNMQNRIMRVANNTEQKDLSDTAKAVLSAAAQK